MKWFRMREPAPAEDKQDDPIRRIKAAAKRLREANEDGREVTEKMVRDLSNLDAKVAGND